MSRDRNKSAPVKWVFEMTYTRDYDSMLARMAQYRDPAQYRERAQIKHIRHHKSAPTPAPPREQWSVSAPSVVHDVHVAATTGHRSTQYAAVPGCWGHRAPPPHPTPWFRGPHRIVTFISWELYQSLLTRLGPAISTLTMITAA